jgi:hypothetical protein
MMIPCHWGDAGLGGFAGRVRFRRRFSWPGRLDGHERIWLTFGGIHASADLWLNGRSLGHHDGAEPFEYDVTTGIQPRNELIVEVESPDDSGGLRGSVALEVRCTAFLRGLRFWLNPEGGTPRLHVAGELVGSADRPLELYVLLDGSTVIYETITTEPPSRSFELQSADLSDQASRPDWTKPEAGHRVQVDLVNGAMIWFSLEGTLPDT